MFYHIKTCAERHTGTSRVYSTNSAKQSCLYYPRSASRALLRTRLARRGKVRMTSSRDRHRAEKHHFERVHRMCTLDFWAEQDA